MFKKIQICLCLFIVPALVSTNVLAQSYTLNQILQHIVDKHPSLQTAGLEAEKSALNKVRLNSQLSWMIGGQSTFTHDVNFFGVPSDRLDVAADLSRKLSSGDTIGVNANYGYEDSDLSFSPLLPNPSHTTKIDLSYRKPIWQGRDNPLFTEALARAEAGGQISFLNMRAVRDQLAQQAIELYFSIATTEARLGNLQEAIARSNRLKTHVLKNKKLGLAEEKDLLQINSQIQSVKSDQKILSVVLRQQKRLLAQLMRSTTEKPINIKFDKRSIKIDDIKNDLYQLAEKNSIALVVNQHQEEIADSIIRESRNKKQDVLDAIFSVGTRTSNGDSQEGSVSEQDFAGRITLEFRQQVDKSGLSAELLQAMLDRSIVLRERQQIKEDLRYQIQILIDQVDLGESALESARLRMKSEQAKMKEANHRYRTGRADTFQVIQFENELAVSELAVETQQIEQTRRLAQIDLITGRLWDMVTPINTLEASAP